MSASNVGKRGPALNRIEWEHPRLGRINETVCPVHESEVLRALTTLGIGCGGSTESNPTATCRRCTETAPPRDWLRRPSPPPWMRVPS